MRGLCVRCPPFTAHTAAASGKVYSSKGVVRQATTGLVAPHVVQACAVMAAVVYAVNTIAVDGVTAAVWDAVPTVLATCALSTASCALRGQLNALTASKDKDSKVRGSVVCECGCEVCVQLCVVSRRLTHAVRPPSWSSL